MGISIYGGLVFTCIKYKQTKPPHIYIVVAKFHFILTFIPFMTHLTKKHIQKISDMHCENMSYINKK